MDSETIGKIEQLTLQGAKPFEHPDGSMVRLIPEGLKPYKMESDRAKGVFYFTEVDSIAEYVNTYKHHDGRPVALSDRDAGEVRVILNWHDPQTIPTETPQETVKAGTEQQAYAVQRLILPNSGDHVARFVPQFDDRFAAWNALNEKQITQLDFAEFLEDRAGDIIDPASADILEVARDLEVHRNSTFKAGQKLQSGSYSFQATEDNTAQTKKAVEIPAKFTLHLPIYAGQPATRIDVALRYRVNERGVCFKLVMHKRVELLAEAFDGMRSQIAAKTGLNVLNAVLSECQLAV